MMCGVMIPFIFMAQGFTFPVTQFFLEDVLEKTGYRINSNDGGGRRGYQDRKNKEKVDALSVLFEVS